VAAVELQSVTRAAGGQLILDAVDLEVMDGELLALIGPSGSGKTSILRAVAGLDPLVSGRVIIGGVDVTTAHTRDRDVAMVFQEDVIFPNRTARGNVGFALSVRNMPPTELRNRVRAEARALDIEEVLDRWPDELAEGHLRLVQIARAMVRAPKVFLLDEPLARLDAGTRARLRRELRMLQSGYGVAMILATTDPEEAMAMADRLAVVAAGKILQVDEPVSVSRYPVSRTVAELTGMIGLVDVSVEPDGHGYRVAAPDVRLRAWAPALSRVGRAVLGVRPDAIRADPAGPVAATVGRLVYCGNRTGRELVIGRSRIASLISTSRPEGTRLRVSFDRWHLFEPTGATICTVG
jgi:ABC-type sugar transport system ATPase subunit